MEVLGLFGRWRVPALEEGRHALGEAGNPEHSDLADVVPRAAPADRADEVGGRASGSVLGNPHAAPFLELYRSHPITPDRRLSERCATNRCRTIEEWSTRIDDRPAGRGDSTRGAHPSSVRQVPAGRRRSMRLHRNPSAILFTGLSSTCSPARAPQEPPAASKTFSCSSVEILIGP